VTEEGWLVNLQGICLAEWRLEALTIAGRPILITLPLTVITVGYMLRMSYVEVGTFPAEAPVIPVTVFMLAVWGTVALAYYLGWRNIRKIDLAEVLRDDTMMQRERKNPKRNEGNS